MSETQKTRTDLYILIAYEDEDGEKPRIVFIEDVSLELLDVFDSLIRHFQDSCKETACLVDLLNPANDFRDALHRRRI